jgi:hypothetical protein
MSDSVELPTLPPGTWTPIAFRPRRASKFHTLQWVPINGALIDSDTAHQLRLAGAIVMASRHSSEVVELVVRPVGA